MAIIRHILGGMAWGVDGMLAEDGSFNGAQINLLSQQSNEYWHIPFEGDSLKDLVAFLAKHLTEAQKEELAPLFHKGIILPGQGFVPPGPQG